MATLLQVGQEEQAIALLTLAYEVLSTIDGERADAEMPTLGPELRSLACQVRRLLQASVCGTQLSDGFLADCSWPQLFILCSLAHCGKVQQVPQQHSAGACLVTVKWIHAFGAPCDKFPTTNVSYIPQVLTLMVWCHSSSGGSGSFDLALSCLQALQKTDPEPTASFVLSFLSHHLFLRMGRWGYWSFSHPILEWSLPLRS